jgi:hypothetical protein
LGVKKSPSAIKFKLAFAEVARVSASIPAAETAKIVF